MTSATSSITLPNVGDKRPDDRSWRRPRSGELVIGGEPRVDLLPPEVVVAARERRARRGVLWLVLIVVVIAAAATVLGYLYHQQKQDALSQLQSQNAEVVAQQGKYASARTVLNQVDQASTAQYLGTSTEVNWKSYFTQITGMLPAGASVTALNAQTGTLSGPIASNSAALIGPYVASIAVTVSAPDQNSVAQLLDSLATLPGFVSAAPGAIAQQGSGIQTTVTVYLSDAAYSGRFASSK